VGEFLLGRRSERDLFQAAEVSPAREVDQAQLCQAAFYAGAVRLLTGDRTGAAEKFRQAVDTGITLATEFHLAKAELSALEPSRGE
jgi:lipoprotein NlpI